MGYHFNPKEKVYVGSVVLRNFPGALAGVATILSKEGINLISSESANIEGTKTSAWGFFAEAEKPVDLGKLKQLIEGSGFALKVDLVEGAEDDAVIVDRYHYPLRLNTGQQAMVFRRGDIVDMFNRIRKIFGSGANLIIYEMGVATGESDAKALADSVGQDTVEKYLVDLVYLYAAEGWGWPEVVDLTLEPLRAKIRFEDSFECTNTKSPAPNGHFVRGHLTGLAAAIFQKKITCVETMCAAKGDPYCEYTAEEVAG